MAATADEHELSNRAYDLAMGIRDQFKGGVLPNSFESQLAHQLMQSGLSGAQAADLIYLTSPAAAAQRQWEIEQTIQHRGIGYLTNFGVNPTPPPPPSPLDAAIADPEVSIYEVIRLAEESVSAS